MKKEKTKESKRHSSYGFTTYSNIRSLLLNQNIQIESKLTKWKQKSSNSIEKLKNTINLHKTKPDNISFSEYKKINISNISTLETICNCTRTQSFYEEKFQKSLKLGKKISSYLEQFQELYKDVKKIDK